jgi:hypothetical protein
MDLIVHSPRPPSLCVVCFLPTFPRPAGMHTLVNICTQAIAQNTQHTICYKCFCQLCEVDDPTHQPVQILGTARCPICRNRFTGSFHVDTGSINIGACVNCERQMDALGPRMRIGNSSNVCLECLLQDADYTGPSYPIDVGVLVDVITSNTEEELNNIDRIIARASQTFAFIRGDEILSPVAQRASPPVVRIINSCNTIDRFIEVLNLLNMVWPEHTTPEIVNVALKRKLVAWAQTFRWETCDIQKVEQLVHAVMQVFNVEVWGREMVASFLLG